MKKKKVLKILGIIIAVAIGIVIALACLGNVAQAAGLVDSTIDKNHAYSRYGLDNYQLDFYVDTGWDWLPWNWGDGIGKSVMYGVYMITNFIWRLSLYISNATGYLVSEAFKLDFITKMAETVGKNIQTLAGVTKKGISTDGFYAGFLLFFIVIVGAYVIYTGLLKRETTKAVHAVVNFVVVFLVSASFIAYAPDLIKKVNGFSTDISSAALSLGTKITMPDSSVKGTDSVDLIRDNLFSIQVRQPWLILQYGSTDVKKLGKDRVKELESTSPNKNDGEDREKVVKKEIEEKKNNNLTTTQVGNRLGTVVFLFLFNIGVSFFVALFAGMMILSQVLFIIFAMFLPISALLSMIPGYEGTVRRGVEKLFNTIMSRAGITLIITVAFSISTMFYSVSKSYPFFMTAFLQVLTYAGIYTKLPDILGMFKLENDGQQTGGRIFRKPQMFLRRQTRRMERRLRNVVTAGAAGAVGGAVGASLSRQETGGKRDNVGARTGQKIGAVLDTPQKVVDKAKMAGEKIKSVPTQAKYAVYSNVENLKEGIKEEPKERKEKREEKLQNHRKTVGEKRREMEQKKQNRKEEPQREQVHKRPVTSSEQMQSKNRNRGNVPVGEKNSSQDSVMKNEQKRQNVQSDISTGRGTSFVEKERSREHSSSNFATRELNKERSSFKAGHQDKASQPMPRRQNKGRRNKQ